MWFHALCCVLCCVFRDLLAEGAGSKAEVGRITDPNAIKHDVGGGHTIVQVRLRAVLNALRGGVEAALFCCCVVFVRRVFEVCLLIQASPKQSPGLPQSIDIVGLLVLMPLCTHAGRYACARARCGERGAADVSCS